MKKVLTLLLLASVGIVTGVNASAVTTVPAISLPAFEYGRSYLYLETVEELYDLRQWHVYPTGIIGIRTDGGDFAPAYVLFDVTLNSPVASGSLSLQLISARTGEGLDSIPILLHDIGAIESLRPPDNWPSREEYISSYFSVLNDLNSGEMNDVLFESARLNLTLAAKPDGLFPVPEPGTMLLLGAGLAFGAGYRRLRRKHGSIA
jgi:hypothetical protein